VGRGEALTVFLILVILVRWSILAIPKMASGQVIPRTGLPIEAFVLAVTLLPHVKSDRRPGARGAQLNEVALPVGRGQAVAVAESDCPPPRQHIVDHGVVGDLTDQRVRQVPDPQCPLRSSTTQTA
jgi:hypothetical protein